MRGAIASVNVYVHRPGEAVRRLTLTITAPESAPGETEWACRVVLADLHRPEVFTAPDSVSALGAAMARGREWLDALRADGASIFRDRAGTEPFDADGSHWRSG